MGILQGFLVIILTSVITGCGPTLDMQIQELVAAKNRWLETGYGSEYTYTYICTGHCMFRGQEVRIEIRGGKVVSAFLQKEDGSIEKLSQTNSYPTVRQLQEGILEMLKQQEEGNMAVTVYYDSELGYPTYLKYSRYGIINGSGEIHIRDLKLVGT